MKKSKFLKKSLAALLAILMVVAMIPLSAAAEEAPEPEGPENPTIRVNNRPAVAQTAEDGSVSYAVTVPDATTVSVSWVPQDNYSAWLYTFRKVSVKVPFNQLDLLQEGEKVDETDTSATYRVTFQVKAGDAAADTAALKEYPLDVTVTTTVPNDDTTIKTVRPNQQFRIQNVDHSFLGIDSKIEGDIITITLPLGMSYAEAGFGDGNNAYLNSTNAALSGVQSAANFGQVNVKSAPNPADAIPGTAIYTSTTTNNTVARRVFIPNSVYSTVKYVAPTTRTGDGRLTVTSRDGHSRNYTVKFVQEEVFSSLSVNGNNFATKTVDNQGVVTYTVPVPAADIVSVAAKGTISYTFPTLENGTIKGNVVRVEDPRTSTGAYKGRYGWENTSTISEDEPVRSGQNTFVFQSGTGTDNTSPNGTYFAYLTVKTRANMAPNATGVADKSFYQDIKIVLRPSTSADTSIALYEFQLNGYDSVWNEGKPLPKEFDYWVDYDFQFSEGDGQHPARISGLVSGTHISIPDQDKDVVGNDYWQVSKQEVTTEVLSYGTFGRVTKPNTPAFDLAKVNTEGRVIILRVWRGNDYEDYTINLRKPEQNMGTEVERVQLYQWNASTQSWTIHDSTKTTSRNFQFKLPNELYDNATGTSTTLAPLTLDATAKAGVSVIAPGTTTDKWTFEWIEGSGYQDIIKGILDTSYANIDVAAGDNVRFNVVAGSGTTLNLRASIIKADGTGNEVAVVATADLPATNPGGTARFKAKDANETEIAEIKFFTPGTPSSLTGGGGAGALSGDLPTATKVVVAETSGSAADGINAAFAFTAANDTDLKDAVMEYFDSKFTSQAEITAAGTMTVTFGLERKANNVLALTATLTGTGTLPSSLAGAAATVTVASGTIENDPSNTGTSLPISLNITGSNPPVEAAKVTFTADTNNSTDNASNMLNKIPANWPAAVDTSVTLESTGTATYTTSVDTAVANPVNTWLNSTWVTNRVAYTKTGTVSLNSTLSNFLLVIKTPNGAVVTPGAQAKNGSKITNQVGVSLWGVGDGFTDQSWPNANVYTELEEGVTTLGDWWTSDYTVRNSSGDGFAATNDDTLYFTVRNGRDGDPQYFTITLAGHTSTTVLNNAADLVFGSSTYATSGVDEDLVYGGNNVTYSILKQNSNIVKLAYIGAATDANNGIESTAIFNPANAAYINAVGGHNLYNNITVEPVSTEANAYVVTIHVPEDFGTGVADSPDSIYFKGVTASDGAKVFRAYATTGSANDGKIEYVTDYKMANFNLNTAEQAQQTLASTKFTFSATDLNAWSSDVFEPSNVSAENILYVVSERDNPTSPAIAVGDTVNQVFRTEYTAGSRNIPNQKYYITVRKDAYNTGDDLRSVSSNNNTGATMNVAEKTVTIRVPNSYNWIGSRENNSHDFQLNFTTSEGALLIDAYQDARFGFRQLQEENIAATYANFVTPDLQKKEQDAYQWVSEKNAAGEYNVNPTSFFVKDGELYIFNEDTGDEIQITGMGDEVNDRYIDSRWHLIMAKEAELRVYTEGRNNLNTYKLNLVIDDAIPDATITSLIVDETTATIDNTNRTATVSLPVDTNKEQVKLSIAVSPLASIVSVNDEPYNPDDHNKSFNINEPIKIVIAAENGQEYTYTLTAGDAPVEPADATITSLTVDGIEAEVNNNTRTATVELPEGSDLSKVKLAIEVSEGDELVSVAGEEFDPEAEYDLSEDIAIVIKAEDGTEYTYTLTGTVAQPVDPVNPADKYTDLEKITDEKTRNEVKEAINLGLMNGISESKGIFGVGIKMERYQFALVVARADIREQLLAEDANADVSTEALNKKLVELYPDNYTFTDVAEKVPQKAAAAAVEYCYKKGYINGKSLANKIFDPNGQITREEAAKIMVGWAGLAHDDTDVSAIPDGDQISNWAKGYVKAAYDAGIVKGYSNGNFGPKDALNREYGACMLVRTYKDHIVNKGDDDNNGDDNTPDDGDDNNGDDDTNTPDDDENNGDDSSTPDDGDNSSTPDEGGDDDTSSTPDDGDTSSTPDEGGESEPAE